MAELSLDPGASREDARTMKLVSPASLLFLVLSLPLHAQPRDTTINATSALRELEALEVKRSGTVDAVRKAVASTLAKAAGGGAAASSLYQDAIEQFENERLPRLLYARANDAAAVGLPNRAATEILSLARTYPQHPDFETWATRLRELLAPPPAAATPEAAPSGETGG